VRPDRAIAAHLAANVAGLTLNTSSVNGNVSSSDVQEGEDLGVYCALYGGRAPLAHHDDTFIRWPNVRIIVRAAVGGQGVALDMAVAIRDAIHQRTVSGFFEARIRESAPMPLGKNRSGQNEWEQTAELWESATT